MVDGIIDDDGKLNRWRACHLSAGLYTVDLGSTYPDDTMDKLLRDGKKLLFEIKDKIVIDEPLVNLGEVA